MVADIPWGGDHAYGNGPRFSRGPVPVDNLGEVNVLGAWPSLPRPADRGRHHTSACRFAVDVAHLADHDHT